jgi:hypothetical protein
VALKSLPFSNDLGEIFILLDGFSRHSTRLYRTMAPPTAQRKSASGKFKSDARSLKRKRDVVDHEKLQKQVDELVSCVWQVFVPKLTSSRI